MSDPFLDYPQSSAGRVFDSSSDLKASDPFADPGSGLSFVPPPVQQDPFDSAVKDEEMSEEEVERIQAAERSYQAMMQRLYEKDQEERSLKDEKRSDAAGTLAKWKEERLRQTAQRKALNRDQEAAFMDARKAFQAGNPWKNVCSMIDFKEKSDGKDTSRMRTVLLAKKNEP